MSQTLINGTNKCHAVQVNSHCDYKYSDCS